MEEIVIPAIKPGDLDASGRGSGLPETTGDIDDIGVDWDFPGGT